MQFAWCESLSNTRICTAVHKFDLSAKKIIHIDYLMYYSFHAHVNVKEVSFFIVMQVTYTIQSQLHNRMHFPYSMNLRTLHTFSWIGWVKFLGVVYLWCLIFRKGIWLIGLHYPLCLWCSLAGTLGLHTRGIA